MSNYSAHSAPSNNSHYRKSPDFARDLVRSLFVDARAGGAWSWRDKPSQKQRSLVKAGLEAEEKNLRGEIAKAKAELAWLRAKIAEARDAILTAAGGGA